LTASGNVKLGYCAQGRMGSDDVKAVVRSPIVSELIWVKPLFTSQHILCIYSRGSVFHT